MAAISYVCVAWILCALNIQQTLSQGMKPRDNVVRDIRSKVLYPYDKRYLLRNLNAFNPKEDKTLNFNFPYYGFNYNYAWVTAHGAVLFSNAPPTLLGAGNELGKHRLEFPIKEWPKADDPALIAPFLAVAVTGQGTSGTIDQEVPPGVYFQDVVSMGFRSDSDDPEIVQYKADLGEALRLDLEEGMIGAAGFIPKHVFIVTWRNMTFSGSGNTRITNTYQLVLTTDEVRTYVMFNYERLNWFATKDSGGNEAGLGGVEAYVGFNAGNGTSSFEYIPYSQFHKIKDLLNHGLVNGFPGRHVFRVDEEILRGVCNYDPPYSPKLTLSPEHGHMLGGTLVNVTGLCLPEDQKQVKIKFHDKTIMCHRYSRNMATCITPPIFSAGYVDIHTLQEVDGRSFANKFYIENPIDQQSNRVRFGSENVIHGLGGKVLDVEWTGNNLTRDQRSKVSISLWGYREHNGKPDLVYITVLAKDVPNTGKYSIDLSKFNQNNDGWKRDLTFGLIQINTTAPIISGTMLYPKLWSQIIPLGWYFNKQWIYHFGNDWAAKFCNQWVLDDSRLLNFVKSVPRCPCTLDQATADKGGFISDFNCHREGNVNCNGSPRAVSCFRSGGQPTFYGGYCQNCCYDADGDLIVNSDAITTGFPNRAHPFGGYPFDRRTIPGLSYWYYDNIAYYTCCLWQNESSDSCQKFKVRRPSSDCVGYQPPNASIVFGDPHFITFDNLEYSFNGKGEFVLLHVDDEAHSLLVEGRFEQVLDYSKGTTFNGTQLTAVVAKETVSIAIEVQLRPPNARQRYHLNVLADGKRIYFDQFSPKLRLFKGVTVSIPENIHNQSHVVITFSSGAGVNVIENGGIMATIVYLPKTFMNITRGLMGNWTNNMKDDLALPKFENKPPLEIPIGGFDNFEKVHKDFGLHWMVDSKHSYFTYENGKSSADFNDPDFKPEFKKQPILNRSIPITENEVSAICGSKEQTTDYQCRYDYIVTQNKNFAQTTKYTAINFRRLKRLNLKSVITCEVLPIPLNGAKNSTKRAVGTKVKFECRKGFKIVGDSVRNCLSSGQWSKIQTAIPRCVRKHFHYFHYEL